MLRIFILLIVLLTSTPCFAEQTILLENTQKRPVTNLRITLYSDNSEVKARFKTPELPPQRKVSIPLASSEIRVIKLEYGGFFHKPIFLKHRECEWDSSDKLFIEPNGKVLPQIKYCSAKNTWDQILATSNRKRLFPKSTLEKTANDKLKPVVTLVAFKEKSLSDNNVTPDFRPFLINMQKKVKSYWHPAKLEYSAKTSVRFSVNKNGDIDRIRVLKATGSSEMTQRCLQAIQEVSPLDGLPPGVENEIEIEFNFAYNVFQRNTP